MLKRFLALLLCIFLLTGCTQAPHTHLDADDNGLCDDCSEDLLVTVDFYTVNDLHGKVADGDSHPGVDELTTYLKKAQQTDEHIVLLSAGDMWQGSAESNMTRGELTTQWMNELDFAAMTLGNHEYDWGKDPIVANGEIAEFPLLAINVYDRETDQRVAYCDSSTMVDLGQIQIGIIGAIGDCYSSISADKVEDVYFQTGADLTKLVKAESEALRQAGADFIVYVLHDGLGESKGNSVKSATKKQFSSYYDVALSDGYVDLVFEGHTHQKYILRDDYGVLHLQNGGDNQGITHAELTYNTLTGTQKIRKPQLISTGVYARLEDDPIVAELMEEYNNVIAPAFAVLGKNGEKRSRNELRQLIADLYYEAGVEKWGDEYDIVLGGGFISVRSPGSLEPGDVTYGMLQGLFPFDNELVLCSISGRDLDKRFFHSDNSNYFISYGAYGEQVRKNIDPNDTYYVIVDTYSSVYKANKLTEIARYGEDIFARDLLAGYIQNSALE